MVYKVLTDPKTNKASGVMYIDRVTREVREVRARAVLLCAQALESARILFNSAPGGLANSSGVLGHYLMDHTWVAGGASGEFPDTPAPKPSLGAPRRPNGIYGIRMKNTIEWAAAKGLPPRLRIPGRRQHELSDERSGLRRRRSRRPCSIR